MALVKCRECGHQVSTEAPTCPQCGTPNPSGAAQDPPSAKATPTGSRSGSGCLGNGCLVSALLLLALVIATMISDGGTDYSSTSASSIPSSTSTSALLLRNRLREIDPDDSVVVGVSTAESLAWITVSDAWHVSPCFERHRFAQNVRSIWRSMDGNQIVIQDTGRVTVADFKLLNDDFDIRGCD